MEGAHVHSCTAAWLKIAHDRFHVAQHMGKAVDRVRIDEHRALMDVNDDTLKGTKHWWLYMDKKISLHISYLT